jgi:hypothetical protein
MSAGVLWGEDNGFRLVTGRCTSSPSAVDEGVKVTIPSFDEGLDDFGPCAFTARRGCSSTCRAPFDTNAAGALSCLGAQRSANPRAHDVAERVKLSTYSMGNGEA